MANCTRTSATSHESFLFGMLTVKESARWLAKKGKTEKAREALKRKIWSRSLTRF